MVGDLLVGCLLVSWRCFALRDYAMYSMCFAGTDLRNIYRGILNMNRSAVEVKMMHYFKARQFFRCLAHPCPAHCVASFGERRLQ
jgi:hypothetical protein